MCLPDNPYDIDEDVDFAYLRTTYKGNQRGYFIVYNIISEDGDVKNTLNDFVPLQDKITYLDIINIQWELQEKYDALCVITFYKLIKSRKHDDTENKVCTNCSHNNKPRYDF